MNGSTKMYGATFCEYKNFLIFNLRTSFLLIKGRPEDEPPEPPLKVHKTVSVVMTTPNSAPCLLHPAVPAKRHLRCNPDPQVPH